jgi:plasmid stabilization system protein ParE
VKSFQLTTDAEQDIDIIKIHLLGQGGPPLVQHVLDKIQASLELLGSMPGIGHSRTDLTPAPVKFWQVFSYFVIYDPAPRPIHITRILHNKRDLEALFRKQPPRQG